MTGRMVGTEVQGGRQSLLFARTINHTGLSTAERCRPSTSQQLRTEALAGQVGKKKNTTWMHGAHPGAQLKRSCSLR